MIHQVAMGPARTDGILVLQASASTWRDVLDTIRDEIRADSSDRRVVLAQAMTTIAGRIPAGEEPAVRIAFRDATARMVLRVCGVGA